ncbi:MAG: MBL fold metallo-hydrolase [Solobacterium sp.]|nr:MBL fold metallo-hydrolase [Solobacterium sp.]
MKLDILPIGQYEENVYVLHDKGHVLIIDPGRSAKTIASVIAPDETVDAVILTHGHADHTQAADDISEMYHCPVYMNREDYILVDPSFAGKHGFDGPVYSEILDLQAVMKIGVFDLQIHYTPGHTAGSVCVQYKNLLFSGDTLFAGSIGRTDLYSGDETQMAQSLEYLKKLPHDLKVLPGHGPSSTIGTEIKRNPFMIY